MAGKPTLKTIAQLAGLAVPTVSRALGDAPDISAATKTRVREIARQIGYVPHRAGVRLRTGRTNVISLVLPGDHELMDMTARLISSIALGLRDTGYHLTITPFFPGDDPLAPVRYIVETGAADAVILNQIEPQDPRVDYLLDKGFPFVTHGRSGRAAEHAHFDFDNRSFGWIGMDRLLRAGRRRVLLVAPPLQQSYAGEMIAGARARAAQDGAEVVLAEGVSIDSRIDEIRAAVRDRLARDPGIDGLLAGAPIATMAAVSGFEDRGRALGTDFDVVSKDAIPFLPLFRNGIMIVAEDVERAGTFLARAAIHAAQHPEAPPMQGLDVPEGAPG